MDIQGNVLVIGASGAIGSAFCEQLRDRPGVTQVLGTARDPAVLAAGIRPLALDLAAPDSFADFAATVAEQADVLDAVLFCAGVLQDEALGLRPEKRLADLDAQALQHSFAINAFAPVLLAAALAHLLPRRQPCLWANLSARVGSIEDNRMGGWYSYRASKAAQNMLTRTMAIELGRLHQSLVCVALHPGTVASPLSAPFRRRDDRGVLEPAAAAAHLLEVIAGLSPADSGGFFAWDGAPIPF